ncbi:MAG TPA: cytochrome o ubiquinol oxidase subunit IV [Ramlibacter sp.]|uniref:cytochrome o ubiquinol oxidase subunit IV n=1 Tax=Ramlibacter sp. TaxID=1917967 RepID=UPI002D80779E|nr:cytochrome o ubiquinol oxidase subunit IV [Ramlibacter sp.]HET8744424.1 cytochrome o ubiquinol oxidase subunit IV [Ramlibacter sp.]
MSAPHHEHHDAHEDIGYHATVKGYLTGFVLSVILTAIPFWLVMAKVLPTSATVPIILGFAAVQVIVHMVYFLHMNTKVEGGWSFLALLFTVIVVVIMLAGSIWVMYNMNTNMMPVDPQMIRNMGMS